VASLLAYLTSRVVMFLGVVGIVWSAWLLVTADGAALDALRLNLGSVTVFLLGVGLSHVGLALYYRSHR
jgi:hypothetical protein